MLVPVPLDVGFELVVLDFEVVVDTFVEEVVPPPPPGLSL